MGPLLEFASTLLVTLRDVLPLIAVITGFQLFVLRRPIPDLRRGRRSRREGMREDQSIGGRNRFSIQQQNH